MCAVGYVELSSSTFNFRGSTLCTLSDSVYVGSLEILWEPALGAIPGGPGRPDPSARAVTTAHRPDAPGLIHPRPTFESRPSTRRSTFGVPFKSHLSAVREATFDFEARNSAEMRTCCVTRRGARGSGHQRAGSTICGARS